MNEVWLVPFKGRNLSETYEQNFLWKKNNIYIMDNHKAALWCWIQHLEKNNKYNLIHIDAHTDTLNSLIEEWLKVLPDLWKMDIDTFINYSYKSDSDPNNNLPLFRWDNYLSIFLKAYSQLLNCCIFATHKRGDKPISTVPIQQANLWELASNFEDWLSDVDEPWICNIDLDFFFYFIDYSVYELLLSNIYIEQLFTGVKNQLNSEKILVLTLCLSPECCGGWNNAELLMNKVCEILELNFSLPDRT
jgi:hypothetical protein